MIYWTSWMKADNIPGSGFVTSKMKKVILVMMVLFLNLLNVRSQADTTTDTVVVAQDEASTSTMKAIFKGPPGRAFVYSLILPGSGQVYNKRYWKLPIVIAAYAVTGYTLSDNLKTFDQYDKAYRLRIDFGMDTITDFPNLSTSQIAADREIVRKNVQRSYIALGLIYFLTAAEAFVDRHLMEFDISEDLGMNLHLGTTPHGIGLVVNFNRHSENRPLPDFLH